MLLFTSTAICLFAIAVSFKINRKIGNVNAIIFLLYNLSLYYCFFYKSFGGSSLVWWSYLLTLNLIHILSMFIYILIKLLNQKKN